MEPAALLTAFAEHLRNPSAMVTGLLPAAKPAPAFPAEDGKRLLSMERCKGSQKVWEDLQNLIQHHLRRCFSPLSAQQELGAGFEEGEEGAGGAGRTWDTSSLQLVLAADQMFAFPSSTWSQHGWERDCRTSVMSSTRVASVSTGNVAKSQPEVTGGMEIDSWKCGCH